MQLSPVRKEITFYPFILFCPCYSEHLYFQGHNPWNALGTCIQFEGHWGNILQTSHLFGNQSKSMLGKNEKDNYELPCSPDGKNDFGTNVTY